MLLPSLSFPLLAATYWLIPLWLLAMGVALGALVLGILYVLAWLGRRTYAVEAVEEVREGPLMPVVVLIAIMIGFGVFSTAVVPFSDLARSLMRWPVMEREIVHITEVPPETLNHEIPLKLEVREIKSISLESDEAITVLPNNAEGEIDEEFGLGKLKARVPSTWHRGRTGGANPFDTQSVTKFYATNLSATPVDLRIEVTNDLEYPQVLLIPAAALAVVCVFLLYLAFHALFPKVAAIAVTTAKDGMSQPIFYVALALGICLLVGFVFIPYNTFGEDVKMLKDSSLTTILVLGILVGLWTASVSIAEEIEGRTALTLLSKPIGRRQFILGKFFGTIGPIFVLFVVLGTVFLASVSYKVVYDARETAQPDVTWATCYVEMVTIIPALVLAFLETMVMSAISVAISTRLPMLANLLICSSIYVVGHLVPLLVASSATENLPIVTFMGQLIATVLPVLDHFTVQAAVAAGASIPVMYLVWALVYSLLYSTAAMLLALVLFEDRDLA